MGFDFALFDFMHVMLLLLAYSSGFKQNGIHFKSLMEANVRSVLVKISAEYLILKYSYGNLC